MKLTKEQALLALDGLNAITQRGGINLGGSKSIVVFAEALESFINSPPAEAPVAASGVSKEVRE